MQGVRTTISCTSCKRRKKGCDFVRPTCGRCQRLGSECIYEARSYTFVNASEQGLVVHRAAHRTAASVSSPSPLGQASLQSLNNRLQVAASFWGIYLPEDWQRPNDPFGDMFTAPWVTAVRFLSQSHELTSLSMDAVAFTGLGWWRGDQSLLQRGFETYIRALRKVNEALRDPVQVHGDDVLASCRTLNLFEMFRRNQDRPGLGADQLLDWRKHAEGTWSLIKLRGRSQHETDVGLMLYDGVRITAVIQGLATRRSNAFTQLSWSLPDAPNLRDDLLNTLGLVAEVLEEADAIRDESAKELSSIQREALLARGMALLPRFMYFGTALRQWESKALRTLNEIHNTDFPDTDDYSSPLINICKLYGDGFFSACTQDWAACISIYNTCRRTWRCINDLHSSLGAEPSLEDLPDWIDPDPYATYIATVCPHFFRPEAGLWGAQGAIFPLSQSLFYLASTGQFKSPRSKMLLDACAHSTSGFIVGDFLKSIVGRFPLPRC